MREILFRGKDKDNNFVYGDLLSNTPDKRCFIQQIDYFVNPTKVDPDTVGQYTGLTDKNGKKIFEGDIVELWTERSVYGRKQSNQDKLIKVRAVIDYGETYGNIAYFLNYKNNYNKNLLSPKNKEQCKRHIWERTIDDFTQKRIQRSLQEESIYLQKLGEIEVIGNIWDNRELIKENEDE